MADVLSSIAVSPSGATLLNAVQVTTTAGSVLNEVVVIGNPSGGATYASVVAGALLVSGSQVVTQPTATALNVTVGNLPATQTVTGAVTSSGTLTVVQPTATALNVSAAGTLTVVQPTATALLVQATGTVVANAGTGTLAVSAASLPMALGAGTLSYGQVVVTTSATQIIAASATRKFLIISVLNNGPNIFLGDSSVATNTGLLLMGIQGASPSVPTTAALYGIAQGTTTSNAVSFLEGHS